MGTATTFKRVLRLFAGTVLVGLGTVTLLAVFALGALRTSWGSDLVLRQLAPRLNATICGRIEVARISLSPGRVALYGLLLHDPTGSTVVRVASLEVDFSLWRLVRHEVDVRSMRLIAPQLALTFDETGQSNLSRAITPRKPPAENGQTGSQRTANGGWAFKLGQLFVQAGEVAVLDRRHPPGSGWDSIRFFVPHANLDGSLTGQSSRRFTLNLAVTGRLEEPFAAPVHLALDATGTLQDPVMSVDAHADLIVADSELTLHADARIDSRSGGGDLGVVGATVANATIQRLHVEPRILRQVLPGTPIKASLDGSGRLAWNGESGQLRSNVRLSAAGAELSLASLANLRRRSLDSLTLAVSDVDLARLVDGAPASRLSLDCRAHGSGNTLDDLDGALSIQIPRGTIDGRSAGPVRVAVRAERGRFRLTDLSISAPGARLTAAGGATRSNVNVAGSVDLLDLGALAGSLSSSAAQTQGAGRLTFSVSGAVSSPSLRLVGHLDGLVWNDLAVPSLKLALRVPDAHHPLASHLALFVPEARLGLRRFAGLSLHVQGTGPALSFRLALLQPEPLTLWFAGRWGAGRQRLAISRGQIGLGRTTWVLQRPAELLLAERRIRLTDLILAAPDQSARVAFDKTAHQLRVGLSLSRVDLSMLPQRLVPVPRIAGRLSADLEVRLSHNSQLAHARLKIERGRIGAIDRIDSVADAELSGGRAKVDFTVHALGGRAKGRLDVPVAWPPKSGSPLFADLDLSAVDLDRVTAWVSAAKAASGSRDATQLGGTGSATIEVRGTADRPKVAANLQFTALRWQDRPVGDLQLALRTTDESGFTTHLALTGAAPRGLGSITMDLRSQGPLPSLLLGQSALRKLAGLPFQAELRAERMSLTTLAQVVGRHGVTGGTASMSARLDGSLRGTQGTFDLDVADFASPGIPPTDGKLRVSLGERATHAELRITRKHASLLSAEATTHAPLAGLLEPAALADTPFDLHATLGPLEWQHAGIVSDVGQARLLHGHLGAELTLTGTPREPHLRLQAKASDIRLDEKPAGAAEASIDYQPGKLNGEVNLVSANGGRFLVRASLDADLGYPAVVHLPSSANLPIHGALQATHFDLAPLSGLSPSLRTVAGQIDADMQLSGTVTDPRPAGRLEWKGGRLVMVGLGDYENIHLLVQGDRDRLVLDELSATSGGGHAKLTMVATHRDGGYDLQSGMDVGKFPVYVQGQELADVSLKATAKSQIDGGRVRSDIKLGSAHLNLRDAKRKQLQSLSQPGDVILVDGGNPIDKAQARKLAQANAALDRRPPLPSEKTTRPPSERPAVVLLVDAPRGLWIAGKDASLEIGLEPGFRVEIADQARVYGQVTIKRGHVDVLGRRFQLKENSSLRFAGPPDVPTLDVTAQFVNAENNVTVVATLKGSPLHLETTLTAPERPDLTESQLYTLIVTGRLTLGGSSSTPSTPAGQAESLLGGLLASQLQTLVSSKLPLDVLTIQTGATAGSARVEAGKYLTSDLYVGYVGRVGADPTLLQNRNAVHFEYALGSRWSFQGEYGDAKTGSLDLFWTKRY